MPAVGWGAGASPSTALGAAAADSDATSPARARARTQPGVCRMVSLALGSRCSAGPGVPESAVGAGREDVEGGGRRLGGHGRARRPGAAAHRREPGPGAPGPRLLVEDAVASPDDHVQLARGPGGGCRRRAEHAPERFPAAPACRVPLVPERVVIALDEDVEAAR